jgi:hypothetical protein
MTLLADGGPFGIGRCGFLVNGKNIFGGLTVRKRTCDVVFQPPLPGYLSGVMIKAGEVSLPGRRPQHPDQFCPASISEMLFLAVRYACLWLDLSLMSP